MAIAVTHTDETLDTIPLCIGPQARMAAATRLCGLTRLCGHSTQSALGFGMSADNALPPFRCATITTDLPSFFAFHGLESSFLVDPLVRSNPLVRSLLKSKLIQRTGRGWQSQLVCVALLTALAISANFVSRRGISKRTRSMTPAYFRFNVAIGGKVLLHLPHGGCYLCGTL